MKGRKLVPTNSVLVQRLFDKIPREDVNQIMLEKKAMTSTTGHIRVQLSVSHEVYCILRYWGAFEAIGESGFFGRLAADYVHKRIIGELGVLDGQSRMTNGVY